MANLLFTNVELLLLLFTKEAPHQLQSASEVVVAKVTLVIVTIVSIVTFSTQRQLVC